MRPLKSLSQYRTGSGLGCSTVLMCFGLLFIVIGVYSIISSWGLLKEGADYAVYASMTFLPLGILVVWGSARRAKPFQKFDKAEASVIEDSIQPGDTFHFVYHQACRQPTAIKSIGVFLVFRERASYSTQSADGNETTTKYVDRLMQQFIQAGRVYSASEVIRQEYRFQIPARVMSIRNPYMKRKNVKVQTAWIIKVRIEFEKGADSWQEYEVEIDGEPMPHRSNDILKGANHQFDVFLLKTRFPIPTRGPMNVMHTLLPHLDQFQIGELFFDKPRLLLERVAEHAAQTAKAQLEAVGARVEIKPNSDE